MTQSFLAWMLVATAVAAPAPSPREIVQNAVDRVVLAVERAEMESSSSSASQRQTLQRRRLEIRRTAGDLFDFDEVARRALSRHWSARSPEEQAEFVRLFTDLLERSYVGRIESYAGERIVYVGESVDGGFAIVRSKVVTSRRGETPLDYRLHLRDGRWKVYDVLIDHVSFVATYRSEFSRIIQKESYAALLERLRKQSADAALARNH
jgi:phospholipid transport system substrate-binding protein